MNYKLFSLTLHFVSIFGWRLEPSTNENGLRWNADKGRWMVGKNLKQSELWRGSKQYQCYALTRVLISLPTWKALFFFGSPPRSKSLLVEKDNICSKCLHTLSLWVKYLLRESVSQSKLAEGRWGEQRKVRGNEAETIGHCLLCASCFLYSYLKVYRYHTNINSYAYILHYPGKLFSYLCEAWRLSWKRDSGVRGRSTRREDSKGRKGWGEGWMGETFKSQ